MQELNDNLPQFEDIVRRRMNRDVENDNKQTGKENTLQMRCSINMYVGTKGNRGYIFPSHASILAMIVQILIIIPHSSMHVSLHA